MFYKIDYFANNAEDAYDPFFANEPTAFWSETNLINRKRNDNILIYYALVDVAI